MFAAAAAGEGQLIANLRNGKSTDIPSDIILSYCGNLAICHTDIIK